MPSVIGVIDLCLPHSTFLGVEGWCFSGPMGRPKCLRLTSIHSSKVGLFKSDAFSLSLHDPDSFILSRKGVVPRPSNYSDGRTLGVRHAVEPAGAAPHKKVSQGCGITVPTCLEIIRQLICKVGFSKEIWRSSPQTSEDPQHAFFRENSLHSSIAIIEGILLRAILLYSR